MWGFFSRFFGPFYQVEALCIRSTVLTVTLQELCLFLQKQPARRLWDTARRAKKAADSYVDLCFFQFKNKVCVRVCVHRQEEWQTDELWQAHCQVQCGPGAAEPGQWGHAHRPQAKAEGQESRGPEASRRQGPLHRCSRGGVGEEGWTKWGDNRQLCPCATSMMSIKQNMQCLF